MNYKFCLLDIWQASRWLWPTFISFYSGCLFVSFKDDPSNTDPSTVVVLGFLSLILLSTLWLGGVIK